MNYKTIVMNYKLVPFENKKQLSIDDNAFQYSTEIFYLKVFSSIPY